MGANGMSVCGVTAVVTPSVEGFVCAIILLNEVMAPHDCAIVDSWFDSDHTLAHRKV